MKDIEKIIRENSEFFDSFEPEDGHHDRFLEKQQRRIVKSKTFTISSFMKVAAIVVLVVLSSLWAYDNIFKSSKNIKGYTLSDISPEYAEVEFYYSSLVDSKYEEIRNLDFFNDSLQKGIILNELSEMDSIYDNLKEDLRMNPNDERIIRVMIEHYQLKVEVMNQILSQLYEIYNTNKKNINYEDTEI